MRRRRWLASIGAGMVLLFMLAQLVNRPDFRTSPAAPEQSIQAHVHVPPYIETLLRRSCYDCHSGETRWPAYARVAPVSWLVARDVRVGRRDLDFSGWSRDSSREPTPAQRLGGICNDVRRGIMPPRAYLLMHADARLSRAEIDAMCEWTESARARLGSP